MDVNSSIRVIRQTMATASFRWQQQWVFFSQYGFSTWHSIDALAFVHYLLIASYLFFTLQYTFLLIESKHKSIIDHRINYENKQTNKIKWIENGRRKKNLSRYSVWWILLSPLILSLSHRFSIASNIYRWKRVSIRLMWSVWNWFSFGLFQFSLMKMGTFHFELIQTNQKDTILNARNYWNASAANNFSIFEMELSEKC